MDRKVTFWSQGDIYACNCSEKQYRHVHCPCSECNRQATDRSTELRHWHQAKFLTDCETWLAINVGLGLINGDGRNYTDPESEVDCLKNNPSEGEREMETDEEDLLQQVSYSGELEGEKEMETDEEVLFQQESSDQPVREEPTNPMRKLVVISCGISIGTFEDILECAKKLLLSTLDEKTIDNIMAKNLE